MGSGDSNKLLISIVAGVAATFLLYGYSQEKKTEYDNKFGKTKRVVVAKEDIAEMSTIYDTMVDTREMPDSFSQPDALVTAEDAIGNVAAVPIKKGQIVVRNSLLTPGPDTGLANQVAPNRRAVTISIDEVRGVAKLIRPGDRVDIYAAVDTGKGALQKREMMLMLSDVVILATGTNIQNNIPRTIELDPSGKQQIQTALTGDTKFSTITVEADPKQAQDLFYITATSPGNIFLALRNPNDRVATPQMPSTSSDTLSGIKPQATGPVPASVAPAVPAAFAPPRAVVPAQQPAAAKPRNGFQSL